MSPVDPKPVGSRWRLFFPSTGETRIVTVQPTGDRAPSGCVCVSYADANGYRRVTNIDRDELRERVQVVVHEEER